ncbi:hypothetical protein HJ590_07935 [Naumannella sp. ID2617S]|nr:hypothetical protein [Naumannella sp. ID2617S]
MQSRQSVSRRALLTAGLGVAALTACGRFGDAPPPAGQPPGVRLLAESPGRHVTAPVEFWSGAEQVHWALRHRFHWEPDLLATLDPDQHAILGLPYGGCAVHSPRLVVDSTRVAVAFRRPEDDGRQINCVAHTYRTAWFLAPWSVLPQSFSVASPRSPELRVHDRVRVSPLELRALRSNQLAVEHPSRLAPVTDQAEFERLRGAGLLDNVSWTGREGLLFQAVVCLSSAPEGRPVHLVLEGERLHLSGATSRTEGKAYELVWDVPAVLLPRQVLLEGAGAPIQVR